MALPPIATARAGQMFPTLSPAQIERLQRFGERLAHNPLAPVSRRIAATEMGGLLGYLAQRVLGQYDLLVPDESTVGDIPCTTRPGYWATTWSMP